MKVGKIDWNDSMFQFIQVKLQRPEVLTELVKRQQEYAQRKSTEHKMENLRSKFEQLSIKFRTQMNRFQEKAQYKKQLQRQVIRTSNTIKKMEVELQKIVREPQSLPNRHSSKDYKDETTRVSFDSDEGAIKKHQEQLTVILADQNQLKSHIKEYIEDLIVKRTKLTENLEASTMKLQKLIHKRDIKDRYEQNTTLLNQINSKLEKQTKAKKALLVKLSQEEERNSTLIYNRKDYDNRQEQSNKKIQSFIKTCKKILMSDEGKNGKKYKQFVNKYRTLSKEQQDALVKRYKNYSQKTSSLFSPGRKNETYQQMVIQVMKKFSNKSFTTEQFTNLQNNCLRISTYLQQLKEEDQTLNSQIDSLQENLNRKTRELEEVRKSQSPTKRGR